MSQHTFSGDIAAVAARNIEERDYWLKELSGDLVRSSFPCDNDKKENQRLETAQNENGTLEFSVPEQTAAKLLALGRGYNYALHMILAANLAVLLERYTGNNEILLGTPIYRQEQNTATLINTVLVLRVKPGAKKTFKELLREV
ncbi:MAG: hypothetical protein GY757_00355, partial [bacterium]|nr:hypothetical protein [bacterium]